MTPMLSRQMLPLASLASMLLLGACTGEDHDVLSSNDHAVFPISPGQAGLPQAVRLSSVGAADGGEDRPVGLEIASGHGPTAVAVGLEIPLLSSDRAQSHDYRALADGDLISASNPVHDLVVDFAADEVSIQGMVLQRGQHISLRFDRWGRRDSLVPVAPVLPRINDCVQGPGSSVGPCAQGVVYDRPGVREWWTNQARGLEQGWTVDKAPDGSGPLVFELAVAGARARWSSAMGSVRLEAPGSPALHYGEAFSKDAAGRILDTEVQVVAGRIRVVVNDQGASWPVTIDPFITSDFSWLSGGQEYAGAGFSVDGAGDVNGDGLDDAIIGLPFFDVSGTSEGAAAVIEGSADGSGTLAWAIFGANDDGRVGYSVAGAGDINGDGYADVLVGEVGYSWTGGTDDGAVWVYEGSATGLGMNYNWSVGGGTGYGIGANVAGVGDINGDGYDDVALGAPYFDGAATNSGRVYVYFGSAAGLSDPQSADWILSGGATDGLLGFGLAGADFDSDGFSDLAIGSPLFDYNYTDEGVAMVFSGSAAGPITTPTWTMVGGQSEAAFGWSMAVGHLDDDTYPDLAVGAPYFDGSATDTGLMSTVFGGAAGCCSGLVSAVGALADELYAYDLAVVDDSDGDGFNELVVGSPGYANPYTGEGAVFVYPSTSSGPVSVSQEIEGGAPGEQFGSSVANLGLFNDDLFGDLIVGTPGSTDNFTGEGVAYILLGGDDDDSAGGDDDDSAAGDDDDSATGDDDDSAPGDDDSGAGDDDDSSNPGGFDLGGDDDDSDSGGISFGDDDSSTITTGSTGSGDDDSATGDDDTAAGDDDTALGDDDTTAGDDDTATGDDDTGSGDDDDQQVGDDDDSSQSARVSSGCDCSLPGSSSNSVQLRTGPAWLGLIGFFVWVRRRT